MVRLTDRGLYSAAVMFDACAGSRKADCAGGAAYGGMAYAWASEHADACCCLKGAPGDIVVALRERLRLDAITHATMPENSLSAETVKRTRAG